MRGRALTAARSPSPPKQCPGARPGAHGEQPLDPRLGGEKGGSDHCFGSTKLSEEKQKTGLRVLTCSTWLEGRAVQGSHRGLEKST